MRRSRAASSSGAGSPRTPPGSGARAPSGRSRRTGQSSRAASSSASRSTRTLADAVLTDGGERVGRLAAPWLRAAAGLDGARLAWAASASGEYPAIVASGALGLAEVLSGAAGSRVADSNALRHHDALLPGPAATIEVAGGERSKSLGEVERVLRELAQAGARRDDGIIALGGGVVGDLAGFCAATYQRGVPVVQAPTTLVAQVDSAYGGKTGVDLPEAKNYAGAYHMPDAVLADPATLETLPGEELTAGFAEVVKTALIAGGGLWERVRAIDALDPAALDDVIFACARTKIDVVAADERDAGRRQVLNLGHTVGHAIETATGYERYRHGEAIALGLLAALRLSGAEDLREEVARAARPPRPAHGPRPLRGRRWRCWRRSSATRRRARRGRLRAARAPGRAAHGRMAPIGRRVDQCVSARRGGPGRRTHEPDVPEPRRGHARRQPRRPRPPRSRALRQLHARRSSSTRSGAGRASSTSTSGSSRPTTRASSSSTCTACRRRSTPWS